MSSISERATAHVSEMPRNRSDLDILREEWRLLAKEQNRLEDISDRMEEGRKILLDELALSLIKEGTPVSRAEKEARTSKQFRDYAHRYHDAKRAAKDARIEAKNAELAYWSRNGSEATERSERRMSR